MATICPSHGYLCIQNYIIYAIYLNQCCNNNSLNQSLKTRHTATTSNGQLLYSSTFTNRQRFKGCDAFVTEPSVLFGMNDTSHIGKHGADTSFLGRRHIRRRCWNFSGKHFEQLKNNFSRVCDVCRVTWSHMFFTCKHCKGLAAPTLTETKLLTLNLSSPTSPVVLPSAVIRDSLCTSLSWSLAQSGWSRVIFHSLVPMQLKGWKGRAHRTPLLSSSASHRNLSNLVPSLLFV